MRFTVFMIPGVYRGNKKIDPNFFPPADAVEKMGKFNAELQKAGALIWLGERSASLANRHPRDISGRQSNGHGWPLCRNQRGFRRLLDAQSQVERRSGELDEEVPGRT